MSNDYDNEDDDIPTAPFWMTTYSDMVTLLLTFFVMIVAMSEVEVKKFKEALSYFQGGRGVLEHKSMVPVSRATKNESKQEEKESSKRHRKLLKYLQDHDLKDKVRISVTERGVHAVIIDSVMFKSGRARLIESSRAVLQLLTGLIDSDVKAVIVEGHTDDRPITTPRYPSNWELSAARASSVVRFLQDQPHRLPSENYIAIGYGSHHPLDSSNTPEARAQNRRVEILFSWKPWHLKAPPPKKNQSPTT